MLREWWLYAAGAGTGLTENLKNQVKPLIWECPFEQFVKLSGGHTVDGYPARKPPGMYTVICKEWA